MEDERPTRIWVHPKLKKSLENLHKIINEESLKKTNYPIPPGLPLSSEIAAKILDKIIENKSTLIEAKKIKDKTIFNIDISKELKNPIVFLISSNWGNLSQEDKEYLNLELQKIVGVKKNEINFW